ncbi:hypothetical protein MNEG_15295 [Monoraphidium neglectum]|uniref:RRM domain-containing protein n=1 Tax=Monoraphidium neglectum TaxID=145388 RepID=A0A0D2LLM3_9CHLO|nr:hypothetical protein MNEG_15295 [Monoraphidium neglectum]KIY92669.1 hypothetical protein MNEG_15295 [Monoraphidium neglectum]|eukprot:XP_013891689.1 hypothetical protein MNEG_15295 [Monoraphidium neglectum]
MVNRAAAPRGKAAKQGERGPGGGATYDPVRSVFVGNLDFKVAEEELVAAFSQGPELQGALEAVRVVRDAKTNIGKGFAFVLFKTKAAARAALALDGTKVAKRTIRVTRATQGGGGIGKAGPKGKGGKPAAGSGGARRLLGVQQGGVAKKSAQGRPAKAAVAAASDWQGLQTKGRGTKVRGPKRSKPSGGGTGAAGGGTGPGTAPRKGPGKGPGKGAGKQKQQGKRPAVAARKAAQRQQSANSKQR